MVCLSKNLKTVISIKGMYFISNVIPFIEGCGIPMLISCLLRQVTNINMVLKSYLKWCVPLSREYSTLCQSSDEDLIFLGKPYIDIKNNL